MIKTRFAPSPTGYLHIWGLRTALYCYLWARKHQGIFMLRVEDTDQSRFVPWALENLLTILDEFGLTPDEGPSHDLGNGPYKQSERLDIYSKYLHEMVTKGSAYYCFCSSERLDTLRAEQEGLKLPLKYDGHCRDLPYEESKARVDAGEPYIIRLRVPKAEKIEMQDMIRGKIEFNTTEVEDQVLQKTDGFPTYHGAIVIDDYLMGVTHVMRGEEWISSIPKQILTARALGVTLPEYAHMPNIMGADGKKLSKRTGDTAVELYLEKGYLPEAILNFVAFLGWNPKITQEIFSLEELVSAFEITNMWKSGAILDPVKLDWMNAQYITALPAQDLLDRLTKYLVRYQQDFYTSTFEPAGQIRNLAIVRELQTRLKRLSDYPELTTFFYGEARQQPELLVNAKMKIESLTQAKEFLSFGLSLLESLPNDADSEAIKVYMISGIAAAGHKNGQILWPLRIALSGEEFSPGAFECLAILGPKLSIQRVRALLEKIA